jgi:nucleoside-diphosphate-sugar epimerase
VPMVEGLPDVATGTKARLRAGMWADAKRLHDAGRIRVVEVRGSDYMGPGVGMGHIPQVAPRALAGKTVRVFGSADQPHSWTDVRDMGRSLVALVSDESTWGRVWHAPTNEPRTQAEAVADVCRSIGREPVRVKPWPRALLSVGGAVVPLLREMRETVYQFERSYVLDSSAIERELGLKPTPWDEVCRATADSALAA